MALTRFNPFEELESFEDRILRLMQGMGLAGLAASKRGKPAESAESTWMPPVDIFEDDVEYLVKVELPDVDEKDVELKIDENLLTIHGRKKLEHEDKRDRYRLVESDYGSFSRSFSLPANVDGSRAKARFDRGVLKVTLPKKPEAKPRHISVKLS